MKRQAPLLLILAIAAFLRLYHFESAPPGLYRDEAMNGSNALEALETGRYQPFYAENGGREGLYVNVAAQFIRFGGNTPWALRLPAAIFGLLTVWGLYLLAVEMDSRPVALLAAFFLATSFWHINFSRMAFRSIAAPLFLTWALYLLLAAVRRLGDGRGYRAVALLAGVVYGLGFYTYIAYRATPLLLLAIWWMAPRKAVRIPQLFLASAAVVAAPLVFYFAGHPGDFLGRASQVAVTHAWDVVLNIWRVGRMFFTRGDVNWRHNIAWRAELFWPVAILLVAGIVFGKRRQVALWWLAIGALPAVLSGDAVPHALRALLMVPAACLLAAGGACQVYRWLSPKLPRMILHAAAALFLLVLTYEPYHSYFDLWAKDEKVPPAFDSAAVAIAGQINQLPREGSKLVVAGDFMEAQPVMFLTRSYTEQQQRESNIGYVLNGSCAEAAALNPGALRFCLPGALK